MRSLYILITALTILHGTTALVDPESSPPTIGIDLGTTYSCVAVHHNGQTEIIPNDQGNRITPSQVAFTNNGQRLVGDAAKNQATLNPLGTISDAKRVIGRLYNDPATTDLDKTMPFKIVNSKNKPEFSVPNEGQFTPEQISAMVLTNMKNIAETYLGQNITNAVITVPAYFNDAQRSATKDAAIIAGLNVIRIINEPTAAALAYGIDNRAKNEQNVLIFDLGGGTFDVSLLSIEGGVFEVLATNGNTRLGGEDFDQRVVDHFTEIFKKKTGKDVTKSPTAMQKLRREAEMAKRKLSTAQQTVLEIENLMDGLDLTETLTRAKFENLNADLFKSTMEPVKKVLADADLTKLEIDEIVLVGGSTRIPKIQALVKEFFGKEPSRGVNPDEAVALGAAIQGSIIAGSYHEMKDTVVIDTTPLSVGIETVGGVMTNLINRNTAIPTKKTKIFSTAADNQEIVTIAIFEGERKLVKDNNLLGRFDLKGIEKASRGVPQIEVSFNIDVNGMLQVTAEEKGSSNQASINIESDNSRLSEAEIEKMLQDAQKYEESDRVQAEQIQAKNQLEGMVYSVKNRLKEDQNVNDADKEIVNQKCDEVISWLEGSLEATTEQLIEKRQEFEEVVKGVFGENATGHDEL